MSQDLQSLIAKIKTEAIGSSEAESAKILAQAKEQAEAIISKAESEATALREKAEKDAELSAERARKTMQQAARDVLITIGQNLEKMVVGMLRKSSSDALDEALLKDMVKKVVETYANNSVSGKGAILLSEADQSKLGDYMKQEFSKVLKDGVTIEAEGVIRKGFQIRLDGDNVSHEFTGEAVAETLAGFLRPQLAEAVRAAANESTK